MRRAPLCGSSTTACELDRDEDARALLDDFLRTTKLAADDTFVVRVRAVRDGVEK